MPLCFFLCIRRLTDDGRSGQPKHVVIIKDYFARTLKLCLVG
jgi:hypothetical protein